MTETHQNFTNGTVTISDEVIAVIAGTKALEVEGVAPIDPYDAKAKKVGARGVKIAIEDGQIFVSLGIAVRQGYKIADVTEEAQQKIKSAIETMTGISVSSVDINVLSLARAT